MKKFAILNHTLDGHTAIAAVFSVESEAAHAMSACLAVLNSYPAVPQPIIVEFDSETQVPEEGREMRVAPRRAHQPAFRLLPQRPAILAD